MLMNEKDKKITDLSYELWILDWVFSLNSKLENIAIAMYK